MALNDWRDVLEARRDADEKIGAARALLKRDPQDEISDDEMAEAVIAVVEALRLEIRALAKTISHAIGEAMDARR